MQFIVFALLTVCMPSQTKAGRVLVVSWQCKSHLIENHHIGEAMAKRGHKVYTILENQISQEYKDSIKKQNISIIEYQIPKYKVWSRPAIDERMMEIILSSEFDKMFELGESSLATMPYVFNCSGYKALNLKSERTLWQG